MKLLARILNIGINQKLTKGEAKLVRLLNYICVSWQLLIVVFIITDFFLNQENFFFNLFGHLGQFFMLLIVQYFQYKERYEIARVVFITSSVIQFFVFCNFIAKGELIEFFYIILPLFSLLFLKKNSYHYFFLGVSIFFFSVVPELFNIYPEGLTASIITMPALFVVVFLLFKYFKDENTRNELLLEKEREIVEQDKVKIEQQSADLKELNEFQTHFFINITHELRTPLTLIKGNITSAKKIKSLSNIHTKLDAVLTQSNKIEYLINDIIDVTKAKTNTLTVNLELHSINNIIQKQYTSFKNLFIDKGISFSFRLLEKDVAAEIDKLYFNRVIGNILVNAAKYTPKGGEVNIFTTTDNNQIHIHIEDNGIGIALGEEEKIFNRFYQVKNDINKASGSGIGLAFCKEVIQLLKGDIIALQNKTGGTTFKISLPAKQPITPTTSKPKIITDSTKATLLLVDDNTEMRMYISSLLTNYNIIEASNGVEALEVIQTQTIDALITDYMMPNMDGYELIRQVKAKKYAFPILVITARADVKSKLDVLALGIDDYLTKPFVEEELLYRLRHSLLNAKNRTKYQVEASTQFQQEEKDAEENALLAKSRLIIEENIENTLFGIPDLVEALNLTERTLYRKIKTHSGLTPNQFIREIKLLYLRNLVEQNTFTSLSELTHKIGFKNTSHLQKLYKERFGTTISA